MRLWSLHPKYLDAQGLVALWREALLAKAVATTLAIGITAVSCLDAQTQGEFQQDFELAVTSIGSLYAYFDGKATKWADVSTAYAADLQRVTNRDQFIALLERIVDELHDPHAQLTVNLQDSPRLVPSGTDLWAEWRAAQATITQVRADSDAARAGIRAGTVVIALDGIPIADVVQARMGRLYPHSVGAARDWALRAVLAGRHGTRRLLQVQEGGTSRTVELPAADQFAGAATVVTAREIRPGIGYIRLNDSLGDNLTVAAFDSALSGFRDTRGLIVDLRNTPSGGNSSVARGILGRFVAREQPYQKHVLPSEERDMGIPRSWLELVSPRGDFVYSRPVVVLVSRWTGSMGEGLAIGFDATHSGIVVGTPMAGLQGATSSITLPRTGIGINIPEEQLYHVNGTPREQYQPSILVDVSGAEPGEDPFIAAALRGLELK
jgi:carboxyl-terminal processing protease